VKLADSDASDAALVICARDDPDAFGVLYERHHDRLVRYCYYRLGDWSDAEDAANESFTNAFIRLPSFDDRGDGFSPWLFRIAHNEIVDRYRRRSVRAEVPISAAVLRADPGPYLDEAITAMDAHDRVFALLRDLPTDDQRRVIELRLAGLTGAEIAAVLGKRHDAVRQLQGRAMEHLRTLANATAADGR
jgi:RNA polymerase sigma-70 factor (ECF subfamily)